jgi:hypothetical protein
LQVATIDASKAQFSAPIALTVRCRHSEAEIKSFARLSIKRSRQAQAQSK